MSLERGELPLDWKLANVSPIFKKGNKHESKNYRPVSLTSVVCKVFESLVRRQIMDHFVNQRHPMYTSTWIYPRSILHHPTLLEVLDDWTSALENGGNIDAIYMDFMKAFDTVPHCRLLLKVEAVGIQGHIHRWIKAFLNGRQQRVVVMDNNQSGHWNPARECPRPPAVLDICQRST